MLQSSDDMVHFPGDQRPSRSPSRSHLISILKDTSDYSDSEGFRSSETGWRVEALLSNTCFLLCPTMF